MKRIVAWLYSDQAERWIDLVIWFNAGVLIGAHGPAIFDAVIGATR